MAPIFAMLIQLLLPVAVAEVKKKLAEEPNNGFSDIPSEIPTSAAAPLAAKLVLKGSLKSKTAWISLAIALGGFFEQNQQILSQLVGSGNTGYVLAAVGGIMFFLRTISMGSLVEKGEGSSS